MFQRLRPLQTTLEQQVFSYTVLTFNQTLKRVVDFAPDWTAEDKEKIIKDLIRLYMVWDTAWKKGELQSSDPVKRFVRLTKESGILKHFVPFATAKDQVEEAWKLAQSRSFWLDLLAFVRKY